MLTASLSQGGGGWIIRNAGGPESVETQHWLANNAQDLGLGRTSEGWLLSFSHTRPYPNAGMGDFEILRNFATVAAHDGQQVQGVSNDAILSKAESPATQSQPVTEKG